MIESTADGATWTAWVRDAGVDDVYYDWAHLEIWAREWGLTAIGVRYRDGDSVVLLPLLRDGLDHIPGGGGHCDLRTAYDFGGPLIIGSDDVLEPFEAAFAAWLREVGCVTLFMRLHPFRAAWPRDAQLHTENLTVELEHGYDAVRAGYYGSWRRDLQKAERAGLVTTVEQDVPLFVRLYAATMARLEAPSWYLFSADCLEALITHPAVDQLVTRDADGTPLATALSLRSGNARFYHLSASDPAYRGSFASHHLIDGLVRHAIDQGCARVHLGAGAPSLKRFKSRVANSSVRYGIVKRIVDSDVYAGLCRATGCDGPAFPAYLGWSP